MTEYLVVLLVGMGGSSYARGPDKQAQIDRCLQFAQSDWRGFLKPGKHEVTVNVWDVTGRTDIWWDTRGAFTKEDDTLGPLPAPELVKGVLKVK